MWDAKFLLIKNIEVCGQMSVYVEVKKNTYFDSVVLMLITKELKKMDSVKEIIVGMGTQLNKELAGNLGLISQKL